MLGVRVVWYSWIVWQAPILAVALLGEPLQGSKGVFSTLRGACPVVAHSYWSRWDLYPLQPSS